MVVPVAVPVIEGKGSTLHEMVIVGGQVMETCPRTIVKGANASHTIVAKPISPLFEEKPWGLAPE